MKPIQLSFDPKTIRGYKILIVLFVLLLLIAIGSYSFIESKSILDKLSTSIMYIFLWGLFFYTIRVQIKSISYKDIALEVNEKGIQLNFFYNVFIPWEDLQSVKTINLGRSFKYLVLRLKNPATYQAKTKRGILVNSKEKNMKKYLTPLVLPADMFTIEAEILEDILNQKIADYKALQAANNANV